MHHLDEQTHSGQLGYWVTVGHQHQGIAQQALRRLIDWAWQTLDLIRLEIVTHPNNVASQKVALACGAQYEGLARNKIYLRQTPQDGLVYALIPDEKSLF